MPRNQIAGIFQSQTPFDCRFAQIADLRDKRQPHGSRRPSNQRHTLQAETITKKPANHTGQHNAANQSRPGLVRTDFRRQFWPFKGCQDGLSADIDPPNRQNQPHDADPVRHLINPRD